MTDCGDAGNESCCTSLGVVGGTYYREYARANFVDGGFQFYDGGVSDPAKVSSYRLDKYLVTVGRYRQFLAAWNAGWVPAAGSGKHSYLSGGQGLVDSSSGVFEPGWIASDDSIVAPGQSGCGTAPTWTDAVGGQERLPINCVNWYEAYAFCIWDGGFLPAEAEWEYAAAGGAEQRDWVWGTAAPGTSNEYSIYQCYYHGQGSETCTGVANVAPVGTATLGVARWGQLDMTGDMEEWLLDLYANYEPYCVDCVYLGMTPYYEDLRVQRGASFRDTLDQLFPNSRNGNTTMVREDTVGMRCARAPSE
jgi:formylglycine-generating enzyme required for sulfatase activity